MTVTASVEGAIRGLYEEYAATPMLQQVAHGPDRAPKPLVMPAGPTDAPIVVVGEAPGEDEEKTGEPFTGPAGRELQKMFAVAGIPWSFCYRTNVLPWRPSLANRTPYPFEISASSWRVISEIVFVAPAVVIAAGAVAWQAVTANGEYTHFAAARGKWSRWPSVPSGDFSCDLLAIYHPAATMHAPANRRQDMMGETVAALRSVTEGERARV